MNDKVVISKKPKDDDGYKMFSVRVRDETIAVLTELSKQTGRSRNEIINIFLEYGITHVEIQD
ncbi:MAG: CopG family transcriptional regulator [Clostridiales bacterium]|nr:MAG: CopG family transcriptional regulator [Clostridiales bacterium]